MNETVDGQGTGPQVLPPPRSSYTPTMIRNRRRLDAAGARRDRRSAVVKRRDAEEQKLADALSKYPHVRF